MKKSVIYMAAALFGVAAPAIYAAEDALNGADRVIVLEDFTSVDCGWCPRGIALCEYVAEKFPGKVIPLAYHDLDFEPSHPEPMGSESAQPFVRRHVAYKPRPTAYVNRCFDGTDYANTAMNLPELATIFEADYEGLRQGGSFVGVDMELASASDTDNSLVDATVALDFVLDLPKASNLYALTFVITEDGVGPHAQKNYYSNSSYKCAEWTSKGTKPKVLHNHVVRDLIGIDGVKGSVPEGLAKGSQHSFTQQLSAANVEGDEFTVVAMLIDTQTAEVVNACAKTFKKVSGEGPDKPDKPDDDPNKDGVETIVADGADAPAQWFTIQGVSVSRPEAPGIYVVKQGRSVNKVVVR